MDLTTFLIQCLNSVQYGLLLFLVASGLTLIVGIMGVINGSYLLTLTDIYGKVVHAQLSELNAESTKQIDLSAYNKGLYLLTIRDQFNTFTATSKILVE